MINLVEDYPRDISVKCLSEYLQWHSNNDQFSLSPFISQWKPLSCHSNKSAWATAITNVYKKSCFQQRIRSPYTSVQSDQSLHKLYNYVAKHPNVSSCEQQRLIKLHSVQADLSLDGCTCQLVPGPLDRSDACPPGNQKFAGSIPGLAHSFVEIWSWNYFYGHSLPTTDSSRAFVSISTG